jgi:hypothetical protein
MKGVFYPHFYVQNSKVLSICDTRVHQMIHGVFVPHSCVQNLKALSVCDTRIPVSTAEGLQALMPGLILKHR